MKSLKDAAALLILLTLLISVRVTPLDDADGGLVPEARAATPQTGATVTPALPAASVVDLQTAADTVEPPACLPEGTVRGTVEIGRRVLVIELDRTGLTRLGGLQSADEPRIEIDRVPRTSC